MADDYKEYLKKFKVAVSIFAGSILLFAFLLSKVIPEIQRITNIQNEHKTQTTTLADAERKLKGLQDNIEAKKIENENMVKVFFKPINGGTDTESAISDEFTEILQLIRENKIKTRSIKYDYDPQDDNFVKNVGNKYHVCRITAEMIANYASFENFMRELYKHEHFLEISKVEILPYEKNKRILLVNMQLKLYAQRDPSSVVETPTPAASGQAPANTADPANPADPAANVPAPINP